jgi:hypothetical protein
LRVILFRPAVPKKEEPHPALSKVEGSEKKSLIILNTQVKILSFGEDLGEALPLKGFWWGCQFNLPFPLLYILFCPNFEL